jgi:hypothetical protein
MRTIQESWDLHLDSHQMQHYNLASSSSNHWNAVMVDVNVNRELALAKRIVVDVVSDALALKMPKVIQT